MIVTVGIAAYWTANKLQAINNGLQKIQEQNEAAFFPLIGSDQYRKALKQLQRSEAQFQEARLLLEQAVQDHSVFSGRKDTLKADDELKLAISDFALRAVQRRGVVEYIQTIANLNDRARMGEERTKLYREEAIAENAQYLNPSAIKEVEQDLLDNIEGISKSQAEDWECFYWQGRPLVNSL